MNQPIKLSKGEATRQRILSAARDLIDEAGIALLSQEAAARRAGISQSSLPDISTDIKRLAPYFSKRGRLELRGCSVGVGDDGPRLLRALAELVGTDVYAALNAQPIGPIQWAGPVVRMRPDGSSTTGSGPDIR